MIDAESALWRRLRQRQVGGYRFRRQSPIGPYVADFVCLEARVVIEVEGGQHYDCDTDDVRDAFLRGQGFQVLRFWNTDVLQNTQGVLEVIMQNLSHKRPHPDLPPRAGEGEPA